jgi:hypothetical protein
MDKPDVACIPEPCHYFVDESGDPTLFNRTGEVIIGNGGCSNFFVLGLLRVSNPLYLSSQLTELRNTLVADPYFKNIPSMQPERGKTALFFHAKDDVPEVRREVFRLLMQHDIGFSAVVRDKRSLLQYVRQRNLNEMNYRYNPNELYDYLTRSLFKERLHKEQAYKICFAKRGKSDRTNALKNALLDARQAFKVKHNMEIKASIQIESSKPQFDAGLQAVDYCLWALYRVLERGEERYINYIQPIVSVIRDLNAEVGTRYGIYYTKRKPISALSVRDTHSWLRGPGI